ncbi:hypothetical protein FNV43_RR11549 [Rhamnella rubrinervis]|uniref:N-acetyltransferase domain-containing protein n=1 Tax=Rhamnella rubrinervis TaxID=2594499 RepID=A0A8K0H6H8_9ROSA|nr:hypothetical protein FNV43_RR11549 [Rhamnella rubrinervis]
MGSCHEVVHVLNRFGKPIMKTGSSKKPSRCHELQVLDKFGKPIMKKGYYNFLNVAQEYSPQSLVDWYNVGVEDDDYDFDYMIDLWSKAIRHLSAVGWVFRFSVKVVKTTTSRNTKTEYPYHSPNENTYDSLRSACKVCMSETERTVDDSLESAFSKGFCISETARRGRKRNRYGGDDLVAELNDLKLDGCVSDPKRKKRDSHDDDDDVVAAFDDEPVVHRKPPARVLCWLIEKKVVLPSAKKHVGAITVTIDNHYDEGQGSNFILEDGRSLMHCVKFYTAVLKSGDELITVATVRIHGEKLAEIALVATRSQYRRLGMCRALINELEKQLSDLGVERLTVPLPAIPSDLHTCFSSLGFSKMTLYERSRLLKYTLLDLPDTVMWHKFLKGFFFKFKPVQ